MTEAQLKKILAEMLEQNNAMLFGQLTRYLDRQLHDLRTEMNDRFDGVHTSLDALAERATTDEIERAALGHQLDRHAGWIGQLAKATATRLTPELEQ